MTKACRGFQYGVQPSEVYTEIHCRHRRNIYIYIERETEHAQIRAHNKPEQLILCKIYPIKRIKNSQTPKKIHDYQGGKLVHLSKLLLIENYN
jgi:hypothetical protein